MTRKDYTAIAAHLAETWEYCNTPSTTKQQVLEECIRRIADVLEDDNPRFDRQRFYQAANY